MDFLCIYLVVFLHFTLTLVSLQNQIPSCSIEDMPDAKSAYDRAESDQCKRELTQLACKLKRQQNINTSTNERLNVNDEEFYRLDTTRLCPSDSELKGCTSLTNINLLIKKLDLTKSELNGSVESNNPDKRIEIFMSNHSSGVVSASRCQRVCMTMNQFRFAAYNENNRECFCLKNLTERFSLEKKCDPNVNNFAIYATGILDIKTAKETYQPRGQRELQSIFDNKLDTLPRVVFFLTLNGRSIRQIFRLIKTIYHDIHFYYIHIDQRMVFLRQQIREFIEHSKRENIYMAEWSEATMWGGTSLLQMHLRAFKELLEMKRDNSKWNWDYVINLSESDFPIKSIQDFTLHLDKYRGKTFLRFHKGYYEKFFLNQALEFAFLQCDNHMWRVGQRKLPIGIQFTGGSDWFCLNYEFIDYVVNSDHEYLLNLKSFYKYSLLPSESFFHTVYVNSPFCRQELVDNHLKFVNWRRKRGCNCQHKNIVDWCGCSPNIINMASLSLLNEMKNRPAFFARKFDPLHNHQLINMVDQSIFGLYTAQFKSLNSYWHNVYHSIEGDKSLSNIFRVLFTHMVRVASQELFDRVNALKKHLSASSYLFDSIEFHLSLMTRAVDDNHEQIKSVRQVEAFFEASKFKGYVMRIETSNRRNNISLEFEAFFVPQPVKESIITVASFNSSSSLLPELAALRSQLLQSLIRFVISTDFDTKERQFVTNYASVMDQASDPALLIDFDPIEKDIEFWITWTNPLNQTVKHVRVNLEKSEKGQMLVNKLFSADQTKYLNMSGIWKAGLNLKLTNNANSLEPHNENAMHTVLTREFLVIRRDVQNDNESGSRQFTQIDEQEAQALGKFWPLKQLCVEYLPSMNFRNTYLMDELLRPCESIFWSTRFPDPKSDVRQSLSNVQIFNNRIPVD